VVITWLVHVVTYLLNTQLPLHIVALGGTHGQIGWLFAVNTGVAMVLRPQVGGWVDRYGARALMLTGAGVLVVTMGALNAVGTPFALIALMAGLGIAPRSSTDCPALREDREDRRHERPPAAVGPSVAVVTVT